MKHTKQNNYHMKITMLSQPLFYCLWLNELLVVWGPVIYLELMGAQESKLESIHRVQWGQSSTFVFVMTFAVELTNSILTHIYFLMRFRKEHRKRTNQGLIY